MRGTYGALLSPLLISSSTLEGAVERVVGVVRSQGWTVRAVRNHTLAARHVADTLNRTAGLAGEIGGEIGRRDRARVRGEFGGETVEVEATVGSPRGFPLGDLMDVTVRVARAPSGERHTPADAPAGPGSVELPRRRVRRSRIDLAIMASTQ